jgi:hypothetical protein
MTKRKTPEQCEAMERKYKELTNDFNNYRAEYDSTMENLNTRLKKAKREY